MPSEWVEVEGKSVDIAVDAAVAELGVESPEHVTVEVLQEPKTGFLGLGGQAAIVKVTRKPKRRRRRRSRGKARDDRQGKQNKRAGSGKKQAAESKATQPRKSPKSQGRTKQKPKTKHDEQGKRDMSDDKERETPEAAPIEDQAEVAREFLVGLLAAFGLEGRVETRIEDDVLYLDVQGEQTEALVGTKGSVMQSVLELTRTVVQRKTFGAPRMRLDIAGYGERRRSALKIYATKLADRVLDAGGEVMLEPMNAADRKVVHDSVAEIDGVRSYSEGQDPDRAVVIALEAGVEPREGADAETDEGASEDTSPSSDEGVSEDTSPTSDDADDADPDPGEDGPVAADAETD